MKNTNEELNCKWVTFEHNSIKGKTLDDIKNNIDKHVGGHPTAIIPKRFMKG